MTTVVLHRWALVPARRYTMPEWMSAVFGTPRERAVLQFGAIPDLLIHETGLHAKGDEHLWGSSSLGRDEDLKATCDVIETFIGRDW